MFAQIYVGCNCGETWRVTVVEDIDCDHDRIDSHLVCAICGMDVWREKKDADGHPVVHELTDEEALELMSSPEFEEDDFI